MLPTSISRAIVTASILILGLGLCAGPALAFTGSNHGEINGKALKGLVSKEAIDCINALNAAVDASKRPFKPEEHCLRDPTKPGASHAQAFKNAARHVKELKEAIIRAILACHTDEAQRLLAEALHAIEDMYAHTNFVFLSKDERDAAKKAFNDPDNNEVPAGLKVASFAGEFNKDPKMAWADQAYPKDKDGVPDPYPHGDVTGKHLDVKPLPWIASSGTPGSGAKEVTIDGVKMSAWKAAMMLAEQHCREFVKSIIDSVPPELWNAKFKNWKRLPPPSPPPPPGVPLPPIGDFPLPGEYIPGYPYDDGYRQGAYCSVTPEGGILDHGTGTAVFIPDSSWYKEPIRLPLAVMARGVRIHVIGSVPSEHCEIAELQVHSSNEFTISELTGDNKGLSPPSTPPTGFGITGKVTDPDGNPVPCAMVGIKTSPFATADALTYAITDSDGNYSADVEPGVYHVAAWKSGWMPTTDEAVDVTEVVVQDLTLPQLAGVNYALNRPAWATTHDVGSGLMPGRAVDGDMGTQWSQGEPAGPVDFIVDVSNREGGARPVGAFTINWFWSHRAAAYSVDVTTEAPLDETGNPNPSATWTTVYSCVGGNGGWRTGAISTDTLMYALSYPTECIGLDQPPGAHIIKAREFLPDEVKFQQPVTIGICYDASEIVGITQSSLRVYEFDLYHNPALRLVPSTLDTTNRVVYFATTRLGVYALAGTPTNILANPGFELGTGNDAPPWGNGLWGGTSQATTEDFQSGVRSWKLNGGGDPNGVKQDNLVTDTTGGTYYRQSAWVKIPGASEATPVQVRLRGRWSTGMAFTYDCDVTTPGWTHIVDPNTLVPPLFVSKLDYYTCCVFSGAEPAYVDDCAFVGEPSGIRLNKIQGRVRDSATGLGVPYAYVAINTTPGAFTNPRTVVVTDDDGWYTLYAGNGAYYVAARKETYIPSPAPDTTVAMVGADVWGIDFSLTYRQPVKLIGVDVRDVPVGTVTSLPNTGTLGGTFDNDSTTVTMENVDGVNAVVFTGSNWMKSSFVTPPEMTGNPKYTVSAWVWNGSISVEECYLSWSHRGGPTATNCQMNYGSHPTLGAVSHWNRDMGWGSLGPPAAGAWHHLAVTFDGTTERLYADGVFREAQNKSLNIYTDTPVWLGCAPEADMMTKSALFSGAIANISVYDDAYDPDTIAGWAHDWPPFTLYVPVSNLAALKAQPVGTVVILTEPVTVTLAARNLDGTRTNNYFYVGEAQARPCLKVVDKVGGSDNLNFADSVTNLTGTVRSDAGGVYLELTIDPTGVAGTAIKPVGVNNKAAATDSNLDLRYVRVWGKAHVTKTDSRGNVIEFTIDDGYNAPITVQDPCGNHGKTADVEGGMFILDGVLIDGEVWISFGYLL